MKLAAMFGSSARAIGATVVGAILLVSGAFWVSQQTAPVPDPPTEAAPVTLAEDLAASSEESNVQTVPQGAPEAAAGIEQGPRPAPEIVEDGAQDGAQDGAEDGAEEIAEDVADVAADVIAPALDLVRVEADGSAVIAGLTEPHGTVALLLDGEEVAVSAADSAGNFVVLLTLPPSDVPRALRIELRPQDGDPVAGAETVIVAPIATPIVVAEAVPETDGVPEARTIEAGPVEDGPDASVEVASAPVAGGPSSEPVPEPSPVVVADGADEGTPEPLAFVAEPTEPQADPAPAEEAVARPPPAPVPTAPAPLVPELTADLGPDPSLSARPDLGAAALLEPLPDAAPVQPARPAAPAVVIASADGVRVVQSSGGAPAAQTSVRLDAISYDASGAVTLTGRGPEEARIEVTLNNQPIQLGEIGPGGDWSLQLPDVDPGTYTLAVTELAADGSAASRVETPFLREDPDRIAEVPVADQASGIDVITVQPGFTLWGIAENNFGEGILYVQIFEENRDQIRDPDWIFPGQIFRLPDLERRPARD